MWKVLNKKWKVRTKKYLNGIIYWYQVVVITDESKIRRDENMKYIFHLGTSYVLQNLGILMKVRILLWWKEF